MTINPAQEWTPPSDRRRLWLAAIKPPMYSVAIIPIWVGSTIAYSLTQTLNWSIFWSFIGSAIALLAWTNISNDVFDAETGVDRYKHHSLVNLTGNRTLVFWIGNTFLALGFVGIGWISWVQQDLTVLGLVFLCWILGYAYQGPPFRLGYQGWGELLCFLCFGPLAVNAAYYSQTQSWSITSMAASIVIGLATSLILFCSHFHQVADDQAVGKLSPVVRLGTKRSAQLIPWIWGSIFGVTLMGGLFQIFPLLALVAVAVSLQPAVQLADLLRRHHDQPDQIKESKFIAVSFHFWYGLVLGLSFL